jgi:hypothetical protein
MAVQRTSDLVRAELAKRFSSEDLGPATAVLELLQFQGVVEPAAIDRIHLAAVLLANGNLPALREWVALGVVDWRDLLVDAGLANADWPDVLRAQGIAVRMP